MSDVEREPYWQLGVLGFPGVMGLTAFARHEPLLLFYFGFFAYFRLWREWMKYVGLLGVFGVAIGVLDVLGVFPV